jgi:NAD(P)H-dependent FMN reductase
VTFPPLLPLVSALLAASVSPVLPRGRHDLLARLVLTGAAVQAVTGGGETPGEKGASMLDLKIIIGSTRPGRAADRVIPWITELAGGHGGFDVDVIDLREWELPVFSETFATVGDPRNPRFSVPAVKRWNAKVAEGDAYLFVTPEYNHSVPGVLKNAIDSVFATFAFRGKPAASAAYSGGIGGGIRAVEHLAHIAIEAEMVPLRNNVVIPFVDAAFTPDGQPADHHTTAAAKIMLDDLAWWGTALQRARAGGILPPAIFRLMAQRQAEGARQ